MPTLWLDEIGADDLSRVGGKAASLGELTAAGLPVPSAFVVTADTYRSFIEETEIDEELFEVVDVDSDDSAALAEAAERAQELILETEAPPSVKEDLLAAYDEMGDADVAVRSSATAEDLPDASFAGQQDTYLNVSRADLLRRVKECWASLFTQRAIYYRNEQGFDDAAVDIAVVVQQMVDAEKSGVMFTSHPSTGAPTAILEAAWGLGEAVVSGAVSPDNYVVDRESEEIEEVTVADKKVMCVRGEDGETVERSVPEEKRNERVLSPEEIHRLIDVGELVEDHYDTPQDVEWAIFEDEVYLLQSRPITTIDEAVEGEEADAATASADEGGEASGVADGGAMQSQTDDVRLTGIGSSPGKVTGEVRIVSKLDNLDKVEEGDIIVTEMTTPDMVPAMKRAAGIVTDQGGMTSHAAIVSRELGVPAVVGADDASDRLRDGQIVTIDGDMGTVEQGTEIAETEESTETDANAGAEQPAAAEPSQQHSPVKPMTGTEVKVNVSIPEAAERAAATGADGVGLLRIEHMILSTNKTPARYVEDHGERAYVDEIVEGVRSVAEAFYPRPVRVRTLDAPSDEFRQLQGGEDEPSEHNPMLGYRGIRRSLDRPGEFKLELRAFERLYELGYDNVELMLPLVTDAEDVLRAKALMQEVGIDPEKRDWGVMVETPASALCIEELCEAGLDFVSFGTNDLTQYTLAVDRNNGNVAGRFDELHPAVLDLMGKVIGTCREYDVATSICGQAASKPEMVQFLVDEGVTSISANIDAVRDVQHEVKRVEQRLLLESVR
ncbi:phosphoenolpyruvate synthase [Halomicroarcula limicola]|uniref:Phosphoenolpyruvate synthase n=1 Tax=Haloarcula limicola TaxID=1429915 RepID=A0A8J7Y2X2_9EURY|nr:phosphoenolpyruvate synthase [Halomicroarcula limicola]MBV0923745.1 phosphoenolpyruvate synthase [Halomicroarcula limicola]